MNPEYFRDNPPTTKEEFGLWWNTMQVVLRGNKDVASQVYQWNCPVAGTCFTSVPEWMLSNDTLLQYLKESTKDYVLQAQQEEDICPSHEEDQGE